MRSVRLLAIVAISTGLSVATAGVRSADTAAQAACTARWHVVARRGVPALAAVAALTATNVWAVGSGNDRPVIVHWNGTKLAAQTFPWRGGSFSGLAARSENDVWAVGKADDEPLAVHFDGHRWQRVQLPQVKNTGLADVAALAADDVWAVGSAGDPGPRPVVMHWDGRRWRLVDLHGAAPRSELVSIDGVSADKVWAFGYTGPWVGGAYGYGPVVLRWNGSRWTAVPTSIGRADYKDWAYGALDIAPSGEVWISVGEQPDAGGAPPLFIRWSGPTHKVRTSYDVPADGAAVFDIAAVSKDEVWAVGNTPTISHLNATSRSWQAEPPHLGILKDAELEAISAISPTEIWAVGSNLIVRYSC